MISTSSLFNLQIFKSPNVLILKKTINFRGAACTLYVPWYTVWDNRLTCSSSCVLTQIVKKTNMASHRGKMVEPVWCSESRLPSEVSAVVIYCSVVECDAAERSVRGGLVSGGTCQGVRVWTTPGGASWGSEPLTHDRARFMAAQIKRRGQLVY